MNPSVAAPFSWAGGFFEMRGWTAWMGVLLVAATGCATEGEQEGVVIGSVRSNINDASLKAINGTYTNCVARSGSWSLALGGAQVLDHDVLSVVKNDASCVLTITEVVGDVLYTASPALLLDTSYQASPSIFSGSGGGSFSANARISSTNFGGNFDIAFVHTDDPTAVDSGSFTGTYASVTASSVSTSTPAPDYTMGFSGNFGLELDAQKNVVAVTGNATLTDGTYPGSAYVVDQGTLSASPTFAQVTTAFAAGTLRSISGANPTIPVAHFGISGQNLASPVVRTVIVLRTVGGVPGYQIFKVTFKSP